SARSPTTPSRKWARTSRSRASASVRSRRRRCASCATRRGRSASRRLSRTSLAAVALALLALCACKDKLQWNDRVIAAITEGPFRFDVPAGWRDLSESQDPVLAHMSRRADATAHIFVRENDSNTDTNIAFMWTDAS